VRETADSWVIELSSNHSPVIRQPGRHGFQPGRHGFRCGGGRGTGYGQGAGYGQAITLQPLASGTMAFET
jgi:hypothetical protein